MPEQLLIKEGAFDADVRRALLRGFLQVNPATQQIFNARGVADFTYLINIGDGGGASSGVMVGRAAQKTYVFNITVNRPTGYGATGDSNDSIFKTSYNNYAVNDANFIMRGYNTTLFGRSPGVGGQMTCAAFTNDIRSGSTWATSIPLQVMADDGGAVTDVQYVADFQIRRQGAVAPTEEGGIRIRNLSAGNQVPNAIKVTGLDAAIKGFERIIDARGANTLKETSGKVTLAAVVVGGTDYFIRASNAAVTVEVNES
jgi:hypothetical protein